MTFKNTCGKMYEPHIVGLLKSPLFGRTPRSETEIKAGEKMYAIIETGGKQYRVENGDVIYIEKLDAEANEEVTFDKVVAVSNRTL